MTDPHPDATRSAAVPLADPPPTGAQALAGPARLHWVEKGHACSALWRSERGASPPKRVVLADDTMTAATAHRLVSEGTGLLWRGDFHNARQLLQALARRIDKPRKASPSVRSHPTGVRKGATAGPTMGLEAYAKQEHETHAGQAITAENINTLADGSAANVQAFHRHRQAQAQRARLLGMVLLSFGPDYGLTLRRAPDARQACAQGWGEADADTPDSVASLRELLALVSAHEWSKKGVAVAALGEPPDNRIHPRYGVFSPVRGEYVALVATAPLPAAAAGLLAFDIGTGTGVLSAVLARRGVARVVATDLDARALACAQANLVRLGVALAPGARDDQRGVQLLRADLFPPGRAQLVVCNPPWLPARATSPVEHAVYDEGSRMLLGFLAGLAGHLAPGGEGWLILSDLAEHLGLRTRSELLGAVAAGGLQVVGRVDARPVHPKASDASDPLHRARAAEVTSLWRLAAA